MNDKIYLILLVFLALSFKHMAQKDTMVDGISYNHVSYYNSYKVKELGNYKINKRGKFKNGLWLSFDKDSKIIEKGLYHKNKKRGHWVEKEPNSNDIWTGEYRHNKRTGEWYCFNRKRLYKKGKVKQEVIASYN